MAAPGPQRVAVRRLRVADRGSDAVGARLRTERALAEVELRPRGLRPGAVLLVRTLRARVEAAPSALDELLRSASQPAREPVPAAANAVLFSSRPELLACLAADSCSGVARRRWWWRLVARDTTPRGAAVEWLAEPESVPAAFALLAAGGRAVEFASSFDDDLARALRVSVARVHGVEPTPSAPVDATLAPARTHHVSRPDAAPEASTATLRPPQASLLRLALTLARAPADLRREPPPAPPPGATAARPAPPGLDDRPPPLDPLHTPHPTSAAAAAQPSTWRRDPEPATTESPAPAETAPLAGPPPPPARADADERRPPLAPARRRTAARRRRAGPDVDAGAVAGPQRADVAQPLRDPVAPDVHEPAEQTPLAWRRPVATDLGGLFFLVGVAQRLGLYADFTEPAAPGLTLDPWRFVAHVGSALVDVGVHGTDRVWTLLAELAREEDDSLAPDELRKHTAAVRGWLAENVALPLHQVVERSALVYADDTRVDAVLPLAGHPIELRLAGIDIDPGWIPAAGRALYFHFE